MKKFTLALAAFFAVSGLVGCSSDSETTPDTPTPDEKTDFTFEVTDLTQGSFGVKILPEEKDQTYYFNLVTKATFDSYADDLALQQADVLYMTDLATNLGISLDQFLLEALLKGDQQMDYLALTPETDYVFYSYGISAEGQPLTGVNSYTFTTPAVGTHDREDLGHAEGQRRFGVQRGDLHVQRPDPGALLAAQGQGRLLL